MFLFVYQEHPTLIGFLKKSLRSTENLNLWQKYTILMALLKKHEYRVGLKKVEKNKLKIGEEGVKLLQSGGGG